MAVKLRLMRMGKKKQPTYRIVAADSRSPRDGRFIEVLGTYAPRSDPSAITLDKAKALGWLEQGAQPTDTVRRLLEITGAWSEFAALRPGSKSLKEIPRRARAAAAAKAAPAPVAAAPAAPPVVAEEPAAAVEPVAVEEPAEELAAAEEPVAVEGPAAAEDATETAE